MTAVLVERALTDHGGTAIVREGETLRARVRPGDVGPLAGALAGLGLELQLFTAADTRATGGDFTLVYVFAPPTHRPAVTVLASLPPSDPRVASLATRSFAASRFEREV